MIQLFINGYEADIDTDISLTYKQADTESPTAVKNTFSKTITLKGTPNNNRIFEHSYDLARYNYGYLSFEPWKRIDAQILSNGEIIENGYISLDKITKSGEEISYDITFYGGIGNFFYNLMYYENDADEEDDESDEKTLSDLYYGFSDVDDEDTNYLCQWNRHYCYDAWAKLDGDFNSDDMKVNNWIVPCPVYNGYADDFDSAKILVNTLYQDSKYDTFFPKTNSDDSKYKVNKGWALMEAPRDLDEWEARDFRVQNMRPAVKMELILNAISNPVNNGGYTVVWDEDFKNTPYWKNSYLVLPVQKFENGNEVDSLILKSALSFYDHAGVRDIDGKTVELTEDDGTTPIDFSEASKPYVDIFLKPVITLHEASRKSTVSMTKNAFVVGGLIFKLNIEADGEDTKTQYYVVLDRNNCEKNTAEYLSKMKGINSDDISFVEGTFNVADVNKKQFIFSETIELKAEAPKNSKTYISVSVTPFKYNYSYTYASINAEKIFWNMDFSIEDEEYWDLSINLLTGDDNESGYYDGEFSPNISKTNLYKKDLFADTKSPFTYLTDFTKLFNLRFRHDDVDKIIYIEQRKNYYENTVMDISDRMDFSDISIVPNTATKKWMEYLLPLPDTYCTTIYNKKAKYECGEYLFNTYYEFNNDKEDIFKESIFTSPVLYEMRSIYFNIDDDVPWIANSDTYQYTLWNASGDSKTETIYGKSLATNDRLMDKFPKMCMFDEDNSPVDDFKATLCFFNGMINGDAYTISDNLPVMEELNDGPCYLYSTTEQGYTSSASTSTGNICYKVTDIPYFSTCYEADGKYAASFYFAKPEYSFCYDGNKYTDSTTMLNAFWRGYLNDIYNINSREVTVKCFLKDKASEAIRKFYAFGNSIWTLTEVNNWNIRNNRPTECTFVRVNDLDNYDMDTDETEYTKY